MSKITRLTNRTPAAPVAEGEPARMPRPQASVKKVAAILDFSERHIRELCARGELEHTGRLRGFRIYLDSVAAWQDRNRRAS
jgi:hypothetical protein